MGLKCRARILKEYKVARADCMWPETQYGPSDIGTQEICGGDVTVIAKAEDEPYFGGSSARLVIEWTCSRCKHPYAEGRLTTDYTRELDITALFGDTHDTGNTEGSTKGGVTKASGEGSRK